MLHLFFPIVIFRSIHVKRIGVAPSAEIGRSPTGDEIASSHGNIPSRVADIIDILTIGFVHPAVAVFIPQVVGVLRVNHRFLLRASFKDAIAQFTVALLVVAKGHPIFGRELRHRKGGFPRMDGDRAIVGVAADDFVG